MERTYLEIIFLCGLVLQVFLSVYFIQNYGEGNRKIYFNKRDRLFLLLLSIGFQFLPLIYVLSSWFSWFDYHLPKWMGIPATLIYCFGVWLFFRAHSDLGDYWSPGLEIKEDHQLITDGVFGFIRHPMYTSFGVIAIAQIFMLQNWIVGPAFLILACPFYLHRVEREERQLIRHFGEDYLNYKNCTNAVFPKKEQWKYLFNQVKSGFKNRKNS